MIPGVRIAAHLFLPAFLLLTDGLLTAAVRAQSGEVSVQVAAVLTQADAEAEVKGLRAKGLDAYWVKAQVPGKGTRYRVRVGRFTSEGEARSYAAQACAKQAFKQFVIAQGESLPPRPSFCLTATAAARRAAPVKPGDSSAKAAPTPQPVTPQDTRPRVAVKSGEAGQPVARIKVEVTQPAPQSKHSTASVAAPATPATPAKGAPRVEPAPAAKETAAPVTAATATAAAPAKKDNPQSASDACRLQPGMTGAPKDCRPAKNAAEPGVVTAPVAEALTAKNAANPSWQVVQGGGSSSKDLRAVFFVDRLTGWAAGDGGTLYRTDDGGKNWAELPGAVVPNGVVDVNRVQFADARTGWMLGEMRSRDGEAAQTVLLSTADGGQIWQQQTLPGVLSFHFANAKVGWAAGRSAGVFKTTDGGQKWKRLESLERLVGMPAEESAFNFGFSDVNFVDAEHGWAVGNFYGRARTHIGGLFMTSDGGETWRRVPIVIQARNNATRFTRGLLHAVKFTDVNHGMVSGEMEDGEETFFFTLHTSDGGETWQQSRVPTRSAHSTQFLDASRGWTAASAPREGSAQAVVYDTVLLRTANGGKSWEPDYIARGSRVRGVFFVSPTQGWAVGDRGLILRYEARQEKASK